MRRCNHVICPLGCRQKVGRSAKLMRAFCPGTLYLLSFRHHSGRRFFLAFYFKGKHCVLNDHIISETICVFCFCVLFSNIYPKIKFTAQNWSYLYNFILKALFLFFYFCLIKYFLLSFAEFERLMLHKNIVKISEKQ